MKQSSKKFDLEERTARFGESIIVFCQSIKITTLNQPLLIQLIKSGTSIGANYMEATGGSSKKDFRNKIYICKKESQETKHWLRMLARSEPNRTEEIRTLWKEAQELTLIFQKITSTLNRK